MTDEPRQGLLLRRREHCSADAMRSATWTWANGVTALRGVLAAGLLAAALQREERSLVLAALLASFAGDVLDGWVARRLGCESEKGAQFDALADRLTAVLVIVGTLALGSPTLLETLAAVVVWVQFGMVDLGLSFQFLKYRQLWSADEFHAVDPSVWVRNWSPVAKLASNVPLALLVVGGTPAFAAALAIGAALIGVRVLPFPSARRTRSVDVAVQLQPAVHRSPPAAAREVERVA